MFQREFERVEAFERQKEVQNACVAVGFELLSEEQEKEVRAR